MPLTGRFDVQEFLKEWEQYKGTICGSIPRMPYILGNGETLEGVFDELVTIPALKRNAAVKKTYMMYSGAGRGYLVAKFDVDWIENNRNLPPDVKRAIQEVKAAKAKAKEREKAK